MRVKIKISTPGHLFGETLIGDVEQPGLQAAASCLMANGLIVSGRWISPLRILEIAEDVPEEKVVLRG